jgi:hypothetical protein
VGVCVGYGIGVVASETFAEAAEAREAFIFIPSLLAQALIA